MNCTDMMRIPELTDVLKLKAGESGLWHTVRWIYFADCLQCIKSEYMLENYIHGGEFVILTNRSVTDDSEKLMTLIGQMWEHGIAALGVNEGQISEELLKYCEEKGLPLFELPEKFPLIDLSQIMCRRLVQEENDHSAAEKLLSSILMLISVSQLDDSQIRDILMQVLERVQGEPGTEPSAGAGNRAAYLDEIKRSRNEVSVSIRAVSAANMPGKDQGVYTLLSHVEDARILDEYVEAQIGKLLRYDEINGGNLCETLENYLAHNCNTKRTAEAMFIHRNTLNYRMKKIRELLNCELEDLNKCLALKLAFVIIKYRSR